MNYTLLTYEKSNALSYRGIIVARIKLRKNKKFESTREIL